MNTANLAFHSLQQVAKSVERFTSVPLAADFFSWCRENAKRPVQLDLEYCKVVAPSSLSFEMFKDRLATALKREENRNPAHWSAKDAAGRLTKLRRITAYAERFEREAA